MFKKITNLKAHLHLLTLLVTAVFLNLALLGNVVADETKNVETQPKETNQTINTVENKNTTKTNEVSPTTQDNPENITLNTPSNDFKINTQTGQNSLKPSLKNDNYFEKQKPESLINFVLSCFAVIALIFVLSWLLKKTNLVPGANISNFKTLAVLPTGPKTKLLLVQVGEEQLLIGSTPSQVNLVYKLPEPLKANNINKKAIFQNFLKKENENTKGNDEKSLQS